MVPEPDRPRIGLLAAQEADEQPGQAEAAQHDREFDERGRLLQAHQQLLQFGGCQGAGVGASEVGGSRDRRRGKRNKGSHEQGMRQYSIKVRTWAATLRASALRL